MMNKIKKIIVWSAIIGLTLAVQYALKVDTELWFFAGAILLLRDNHKELRRMVP